MTDSDTQSPEAEETHGSLVPAEPAEPKSQHGLEVDGETFFPILKDVILVLFVVFFGLMAFAIKSSGNGGSGAAVGGAGSGTIDVALDEFAINGQFIAPAGEVTLEITNAGTVTHNVVARNLGRRTVDLDIGGRTTLSLGVLEPGSYELFCDITGHEASGMVTTLTVT
jgi:plastocyanin